MPQADSATHTNDPLADRKAMRRTARAARGAFVATLNPAVRGALEKALAAQLVPHLGPAGILGTHAAIGDEIDPHAVEATALSLGWRLAFPRVTDGPLSYHLCGRGELTPGYKGIPEPCSTGRPARPDVLLVPLMAADLAGNRLGQGGGHYDRWFEANPDKIAIGLAWDCQLVDTLPLEAHDHPLAAVVTPTRLYGPF